MTRVCPTCGRSYPDAVFFCGHDGTITVQDQDTADFDPRLGKRLGGYIVAARVADGAMGRIFEGRHPDTKGRVAIKVLHADVAKDQIAVERFKREFETAKELPHPHIVKVLEFGDTSDASYFLTMEFLEGEELGKVLGKGTPLAPERVVRVVCQVALALEHAHAFGAIHRDLKPDNIFLCRTDAGDDVRVLDFGSVKLQMDTGQKLTAVGTTLGSPYYMSPEQAMGRPDVDRQSDVFALGAVLYEMLTGRVAFEAPNIAKVLLRIMKETPAAPTRYNPTLPAAIDGVIGKALAKSKADRYGSVADLTRAVLAAYGLDGSIEVWAKAPTEETMNALQKASLQRLVTTPAPALGAGQPLDVARALDAEQPESTGGTADAVAQKPTSARPAAELRAKLTAISTALQGGDAPAAAAPDVVRVEQPLPPIVAPLRPASAAPPDFRRPIPSVALIALGMLIGGALVAVFMK